MALLQYRRLNVIITELGSPGSRPSNVLLCWELVKTHSGMPDVRFSVERSLSPSFPEDEYEVLASDIPGVAGQMVYTFSDVTANLYSFWRRYFYRIRAVSPDGTFVTQSQTWETSPRPHELEIIAQHDFVLRYLQGTPSFAFIERTADAPNCICFDVTTQRSTRSDCTLCLGTGKQRPFFDPIPLYVDYNPDAKLVQISLLGEITPNQKDCWFSAYPLLKPADVIYEVGPARLWRIVRMSPIQPQGTTIQQIARLEAVDLTLVEHQRLPRQISTDLLSEIVREWELIKEERLF